MTDEQIIHRLDELEARLRSIEHGIFAVRRALRERIDPYKRRKDLGYWPDEESSDALRPMPTAK